MDPNNLSSNWKKLQTTLRQRTSVQGSTSTADLKRKRSTRGPQPQDPSRSVNSQRKRRKHGMMSPSDTKETLPPETVANTSTNDTMELPKSAPQQVRANAGLSSGVDIGRYVAVDCEMVGVGPEPDRESALARVSIINYDGEQIYDSYVKPLEEVTDWRTHVSGILPKHMAQARTLREVQTDVCDILQGRLLIGHAIRHDLDALLISHPKIDIRDTARHPPYRKLAGGNSPRLKILASELLGLHIQEGEHSSVDDARACMLLFRRDKAGFEREHAKRWPAPRPPLTVEDGPPSAKSKKSKKKKKKR